VRIGHLVGEVVGDPLFEVHLAFDVQINVHLLIFLVPEEGQRCPETNKQELEGEDGVKHLVHCFHKI